MITSEDVDNDGDGGGSVKCIRSDGLIVEGNISVKSFQGDQIFLQCA